MTRKQVEGERVFFSSHFLIDVPHQKKTGPALKQIRKQ